MAEVPNTPAGVTISSDGKEYFLPRVSQKVMDDYEAYTSAKALDRVRAMAQFQAPAENEAAYREVVRQLKVGGLGWDTEDSYETRRTLDGLTRACWIAIRTQAPEIKLDDVQAIARREGGNFLLQKYLQANADPTVPPPPPSADGGVSAPGSPSTTA